MRTGRTFYTRMATKQYKAKDFNNREALESAILDDFDGSVSPKDALIVGTEAELQPLRLRHQMYVYGVKVTASDFVINNKKAVPRGKRVQTKINGVKQKK